MVGIRQRAATRRRPCHFGRPPRSLFTVSVTPKRDILAVILTGPREESWRSRNRGPRALPGALALGMHTGAIQAVSKNQVGDQRVFSFLTGTRPTMEA